MGWKKTFLTLIIGFITVTSAMGDNPTLVNVALDEGFVPIGFDSNDRSQVTVTGIFSDACYKVGPHKVRVDEETKKIYIQQTAYYYIGFCLQILVPYTEVVDLGILKEGTYEIRDQQSGKVLGSLPIARAKSVSADDYLYAPVASASVRTEDGKHYLSLRGNFTDRCMRLKEVLVNYYKDVVVVQPIAEYLGTPHNCGHEMVRFQHEERLKDELKGNMLLHVRSMEGQAINEIVDFL